jgi:hypothetical protein
LCDDVIIVRDGQVIEQEQIEVLRKRALRRVEFRFARGILPPNHWPSGFAELLVHPQGVAAPSGSAATDHVVSGTWSGPVAGLLAWLGSLPLEDVVIDKPGLEDLFLAYYSVSGTAGAKAGSSSEGNRGGDR